MIKLCDVGPIWREGEQGGKQMKNWRGRTGSGAEAGRGEIFGRGAGAGERVVKNLARGGEKLEGALERERGGDKISRSGRGLDGGIHAGRGMDRKRGFSPHPGSDPIISVQCHLP